MPCVRIFLTKIRIFLMVLKKSRYFLSFLSGNCKKKTNFIKKMSFNGLAFIIHAF